MSTLGSWVDGWWWIQEEREDTKTNLSVGSGRQYWRRGIFVIVKSLSLRCRTLYPWDRYRSLWYQEPLKYEEASSVTVKLRWSRVMVDGCEVSKTEYLKSSRWWREKEEKEKKESEKRKGIIYICQDQGPVSSKWVLTLTHTALSHHGGVSTGHHEPRKKWMLESQCWRTNFSNKPLNRKE